MFKILARSVAIKKIVGVNAEWFTVKKTETSAHGPYRLTYCAIDAKTGKPREYNFCIDKMMIDGHSVDIDSMFE